MQVKSQSTNLQQSSVSKLLDNATSNQMVPVVVDGDYHEVKAGTSIEEVVPKHVPSVIANDKEIPRTEFSEHCASGKIVTNQVNIVKGAQS